MDIITIDLTNKNPTKKKKTLREKKNELNQKSKLYIEQKHMPSKRKKKDILVDNFGKHYELNERLRFIKKNSYIKNVLFLSHSLNNQLFSTQKQKLHNDSFNIIKPHQFHLLREINYSVKQLREICKHYGYSQSGTKMEMIIRIFNNLYFSHHIKKIQYTYRSYQQYKQETYYNPIINIQKICRGYIVRNFLSEYQKCYLPSFRKKICCNDTEIESFDDIDTLPLNKLFFYKEFHDERNYSNQKSIYKKDGFHIYAFTFDTMNNLIKTAKYNQDLLRNPYNRLIIKPEYIKWLASRQEQILLYLGIINQKNKNTTISKKKKKKQKKKRHLLQSNQTNFILRSNNDNITTLNNGDGGNNNNTDNNGNICPTQITERYYHLLKPQYTLEQFTNDVFCEIDRIGNYTDSSWFLSLSDINIRTMFHSLYDNWFFNLGLDVRVRERLIPSMPRGNPFYIINSHNNRGVRMNISTIFCSMPPTLARRTLLAIINILITDCPDINERKTCCYYVLGSLTTVSDEARRHLPWLYESFN